MKISDYFERSRYASVPGKKSGLDKGKIFSLYKKFECILSSCRLVLEKAKNPEFGGLKVSDYLKNPVQVKQSGRTFNRTDFRKIGKQYWNASVSNRDLAKYRGFYKNGVPTGMRQKQKVASAVVHRADILKESHDISNQKEIDRSIKEASAKYGLPVCLIRAVIKAESDFQVTAVSSAGARGLMQLMPETAEDLGVEDPFDIEQNIDGGTRYLKQLLDLFGKNIKLALAAYNAGPGTVNRYNGNVPYRETRLYVERVLEYSRRLV